MKIHSYSSPYNLGHAALRAFEGQPGLLDVPVNIEEKVDGSQFSFWLNSEANTVEFKSRGATVHPEDAGMFSKAVAAVFKAHDDFGLTPGYIYRAEYLMKPKHNSLAYDRVPKNHLLIFDIESSPYNFLSTSDRATETLRLEFEAVTLFGQDIHFKSINDLDFLLKQTSQLGGQKIEGVVIKPSGYNLFTRDKKVMMGKYVSEEFKEVHRKNWKVTNPSGKDFVESLTERLKTEARWSKAVQHLQEVGQLEDSPRDIGKLIAEVKTDVLKDEEEAIKAALFKHYAPQIARGLTHGLPEWYKRKLAEAGFIKEEKSE